MHLPFLNQVREREQAAERSRAESAAAVVYDEHPLLTDVRRTASRTCSARRRWRACSLGDEETRSALAQIQHLILGGEALPGDLLSDLRRHCQATITNMYGPTETTVWSTTHSWRPTR